jgi:hypothetical protein
MVDTNTCIISVGTLPEEQQQGGHKLHGHMPTKDIIIKKLITLTAL